MVTILDDVTLIFPRQADGRDRGTIREREITLLGLIAGLDRPTSGTICLNGVDITGLGERRWLVCALPVSDIFFSHSI